jgi:hypothetical protein
MAKVTSKARKPKRTTAKSPTKPEELLDLSEGPLAWLTPMLEESYTKLRPREEAEAEEAEDAAPAARRTTKAELEDKTRRGPFKSVHRQDKDESVLAQLPRSH